jgi:hypothetical protein
MPHPTMPHPTGNSPDPPQQTRKRSLQRPGRQAAGEFRKGSDGVPIRLIHMNFGSSRRIGPDLHPHADSSKLPVRADQRGDEVGRALPHDGSNRTGVDRELKHAALRTDDPNAFRQGSWQVTADDAGQHLFAVPARNPAGDGGVGRQNKGKWLGRSRHCAESEVERVRGSGAGARWRRCI